MDVQHVTSRARAFTNAMNIPEEIVVISTDAEQMFPSLEIEIVAHVAAEEFINSKLDIDMDWQELSLYLAVTNTQQQLDQLVLSHVTHARVHRTGPRPEITTEEIVNRNSDTVSKFKLPNYKFTNQMGHFKNSFKL